MGILSMLGISPDAGGGLGLLGNLGQTLHDNSNALLGFASGGPQGMVRGGQVDMEAAKERQSREDKQKLLAWSEQVAKSAGRPELAGNPALAQQYWLAANKPQEQTGDIREFEYARNNGYKGSFSDWQTKKASAMSGGGYGLNPIYGTDEQNNPVIGQLGKDGTFKATQLPTGFKISTGIEKVDAGTRWALYDKRSGQLVGYEPKDVAGAAAQQEIGKADGAAVVAAPGQIASADVALDRIKQVRNHPGFSRAVGWESRFPTSNGSKAAGFENLVMEVKSGAFKTAIDSLRGLGAMSEREGEAATAAINRMNIATSEEDFMKAVDDYEQIVLASKAKAQQILARRGPQAPAQGAPSGGGASAGSGISSGSYNYVPGQGLVPAR